MSVPGIEAISGFTPAFPAVQGIDQAAAAQPTHSVQGPSGPAPTEFGNLLTDGIDRLEGLQDKAATLAIDAATGNLTNIHDYTVASTEASVATQLTVAVRNKAIEAFNEIMRMQV